MEKHFMLFVRKNQYRENGHTVQSNLQIKQYPHQTTNGLLHGTGKNRLKLHMEPKGSPHSSQIQAKITKLEASHYLTLY